MIMSECTIQNTTNTEIAEQPKTVNAETQQELPVVTPQVDLYEVENGLVLKADLPGLSSNEIQINVEQNILTISGKPEATNNAEYDYQEYTVPQYFRQFKLAETIDQESIQASYEHGVLTLNLKIAERAKPKKIAVNVG